MAKKTSNKSGATHTPKSTADEASGNGTAPEGPLSSTSEIAIPLGGTLDDARILEIADLLREHQPALAEALVGAFVGAGKIVLEPSDDPAQIQAAAETLEREFVGVAEHFRADGEVGAGFAEVRMPTVSEQELCIFCRDPIDEMDLEGCENELTTLDALDAKIERYRDEVNDDKAAIKGREKDQRRRLSGKEQLLNRVWNHRSRHLLPRRDALKARITAIETAKEEAKKAEAEQVLE